VSGTPVDRQGGHASVRVQGGREGRVRDQKGELSVVGGHQLEAPEDLGGDGLGGGAEFAAQGGSAVDGQRGGELHVERLAGRLLLAVLWIVHADHLAHAAGQVVEEPRPHLGVNALGGRQETRHLVHALVEARPVLAQDRGVCRQCCWRREQEMLSYQYNTNSSS